MQNNDPEIGLSSSSSSSVIGKNKINTPLLASPSWPPSSAVVLSLSAPREPQRFITAHPQHQHHHNYDNHNHSNRIPEEEKEKEEGEKESNVCIVRDHRNDSLVGLAITADDTSTTKNNNNTSNNNVGRNKNKPSPSCYVRSPYLFLEDGRRHSLEALSTRIITELQGGGEVLTFNVGPCNSGKTTFLLGSVFCSSSSKAKAKAASVYSSNTRDTSNVDSLLSRSSREGGAQEEKESSDCLFDAVVSRLLVACPTAVLAIGLLEAMEIPSTRRGTKTMKKGKRVENSLFEVLTTDLLGARRLSTVNYNKSEDNDKRNNHNDTYHSDSSNHDPNVCLEGSSDIPAVTYVRCNTLRQCREVIAEGLSHSVSWRRCSRPEEDEEEEEFSETYHKKKRNQNATESTSTSISTHYRGRKNKKNGGHSKKASELLLRPQSAFDQPSKGHLVLVLVAEIDGIPCVWKLMDFSGPVPDPYPIILANPNKSESTANRVKRANTSFFYFGDRTHYKLRNSLFSLTDCNLEPSKEVKVSTQPSATTRTTTVHNVSRTNMKHTPDKTNNNSEEDGDDDDDLPYRMVVGTLSSSCTAAIVLAHLNSNLSCNRLNKETLEIAARWDEKHAHSHHHNYHYHAVNGIPSKNEEEEERVRESLSRRKNKLEDNREAADIILKKFAVDGTAFLKYAAKERRKRETEKPLGNCNDYTNDIHKRMIVPLAFADEMEAKPFIDSANDEEDKERRKEKEEPLKTAEQNGANDVMVASKEDEEEKEKWLDFEPFSIWISQTPNDNDTNRTTLTNPNHHHLSNNTTNGRIQPPKRKDDSSSFESGLHLMNSHQHSSLNEATPKVESYSPPPIQNTNNRPHHPHNNNKMNRDSLLSVEMQLFNDLSQIQEGNELKKGGKNRPNKNSNHYHQLPHQVHNKNNNNSYESSAIFQKIYNNIEQWRQEEFKSLKELEEVLKNTTSTECNEDEEAKPTATNAPDKSSNDTNPAEENQVVLSRAVFRQMKKKIAWLEERLVQTRQQQMQAYVKAVQVSPATGDTNLHNNNNDSNNVVMVGDSIYDVKTVLSSRPYQFLLQQYLKQEEELLALRATIANTSRNANTDVNPRAKPRLTPASLPQRQRDPEEDAETRKMEEEEEGALPTPIEGVSPANSVSLSGLGPLTSRPGEERAAAAAAMDGAGECVEEQLARVLAMAAGLSPPPSRDGQVHTGVSPFEIRVHYDDASLAAQGANTNTTYVHHPQQENGLIVKKRNTTGNNNNNTSYSANFEAPSSVLQPIDKFSDALEEVQNCALRVLSRNSSNNNTAVNISLRHSPQRNHTGDNNHNHNNNNSSNCTTNELIPYPSDTLREERQLYEAVSRMRYASKQLENELVQSAMKEKEYLGALLFQP